jgi:phthiodiolone/phenolphthiodiolone dimycocerosates ketoreductase
MAHKPKIWALGGGPRLLDLATSYADGMTYLAPQAWDTPERAAAEIATLKQELERKGRDPETFEFAVWISALIHEDADFITQMVANPLMRWMAAIWGRVNLRDWKALGVESALPEDYHYAMDLLPLEVTAQEAQDVIERVSPKQQRLSWIHGSPKEVGALLGDYAEAGVTWMAVADLIPMIVPPDDPATSMQRTIEVCAMLRDAETAQ